MKIVAVNVGLPRQVPSDGKLVSTGIYKSPVHRRLKVSRLNIEGDAQADLSAHGGPNKAVYAYPSEHYGYWRRELPGIELPWGVFGENLTTEGLLEGDACIGDRFRMGTTILMITQPRLPCYKLGIRFDCEDMPRSFLASRHTGFYFAVIKEGELCEGDFIERIESGPHQVSVADILHLYLAGKDIDIPLLERAMQVEALPAGWRKHLLQRLEAAGK